MAAKEFTIDDLRRILRAAAGEVDLDSDILDVTFIDLGYDSVALLETSRRIELERSVELGDSTVNDAHTPRALLAVVNGQLGAAAAV
jgi:act minimal PKS acyl carrier protein